MIQHMVLAMLAPIFLALGAPVTLALRTLPPKPRHWLVAALHSKIAKVLSFPLVSFGLYVATPFALYFSGIYRLTLEHEWVHDLTHVHFILIGCLFFWPLIGLDPLPGRWPYPARALLMILSHAVPRRTRPDDHGEQLADRRRLLPRTAPGLGRPGQRPARRRRHPVGRR